MGVVSIDIEKNEREWHNLTLSDFDTVKYLILYRHKVDVVYNASVNINIYQAGDTFDFNKELIAMYASLDNIVEQCKFKDKQKELLRLIFEGNTLQDVCKMDIGFKKSATYELFDRMIIRIVEANNNDWSRCMFANGYTKHPK